MHAWRSLPDQPTRRRRTITPGHRELVLFTAIYLLYDGARWAFHGRFPTADHHAHWIFNLERHTHLDVEAGVQHALGSGATGWLLANIYLAAQLLVLPAALVWLYRRDRDVYRRLRTTVAGAWLISIPVFALYPVAPPRLAGIGIGDTVSHQAGVGLTGHSTMFYNPYAAVPSLHVGLAFAIAIAVAAVTRRRWARAMALCWGPLVTLAVVATGNHFVFDAVAGVVVSVAAFGLSHVHFISRSPVTARPVASRAQFSPHTAAS